VGRVVQRLCEIETYKAMSMLGLLRARALSPILGKTDARLSSLVEGMAAGPDRPDETLQELLSIAADLENLLSKSSFRFGATGAYEALVNDRVAALRETRYGGRQTFGEFMARRYDPAMRTVKSSQRQLEGLALRATRAAELLRTRVDVGRSAENQALLASMDRRSDLQLRLQHTVEGLSVVAISYYALNLATYLLGPLAEQFEISKSWLTAGLVLPVIGLVWLLIRRIRRAVTH